MAKLQTFWDYIFSRENKQLQTLMNQGPQRQSARFSLPNRPPDFLIFFLRFAKPESLLCVSFLQDNLFYGFHTWMGG